MIVNTMTMAEKTKMIIKSMILVIVTGTNGLSSAGLAYAEKQLLCLYKLCKPNRQCMATAAADLGL